MTLDRDKYLDDEELRALLAATRERRRKTALRDRALFLVASTLGPRPSELVGLNVPDVRFGVAPMLRVRRKKKRRELGVIDDLPLSASVARVLRVYIRVNRLELGPLFPSQVGKRLTVRSVERLFKYYAGRAGLRDVYTVKALRHTVGRRLLAATKDLRVVQRVLGHASSRTTEIYAHVDDARLREAAESIASKL